MNKQRNVINNKDLHIGLICKIYDLNGAHVCYNIMCILQIIKESHPLDCVLNKNKQPPQFEIVTLKIHKPRKQSYMKCFHYEVL